jgi:integrase
MDNFKVRFLKRGEQINYRVYYNGKTFEIFSGIKTTKPVNPQSGIIGYKGSEADNIKLYNQKAKIEESIDDLLKRNEDITIGRLKTLLKGSSSYHRATPKFLLSDLLKEAKQYYSQQIVISSKGGQKLRQNTIDNALSAVSTFRELGIDEDIGLWRGLSVDELNIRIANFRDKVITSLLRMNYTDSTVAFKISLLKTFIIRKYPALRSSLIDLKYSSKLKESEVFTISEDQAAYIIKNFHAIAKESPPLELYTLEYWVTALLLSPRYGDMLKFTEDNIVYAQDGTMWLKYLSDKTASPITVPVPQLLKEIFLKNMKRFKGRLLYKLGNPTINQKIKVIGKRIGIFNNKVTITQARGGDVVQVTCHEWERLSIHKMRASAISNMLMNGMPEHIVKSFSGHTADSTAFRRYVKMSDQAKSDYYNNFIQNYND